MTVSGHKQLEGYDGQAVLGMRSNGKRIFAAEFKAALVRRCLQRGVSVAATAMAHGINANLLRRWIVKAGEPAEPGPVNLLPVSVQDGALMAPSAMTPCRPMPTPEGWIEIEIYGARVKLHGELDARRLAIVLNALAPRR